MMTMAGSSRKMKRTLPMIDIGPSFKKKADPSAFEDAAYTSTSPSDSTIQVQYQNFNFNQILKNINLPFIVSLK